MNARRGLALLSAASIVAAGCGAGPGGTGAESTADPTATVPPEVTAPDDVDWYLVSGLSTTGWESWTPTATFRDGRMAGDAGCNSYSYPYRIDGATMTIDGARGGPVTQMFCDGAGEVTDAEFRSLVASGVVGRWSIGADGLVLAGSSGAEVLRFAAVNPAGAWSASMVRLPYSLGSLEPGSEITATFGDDGTLTGSAGCNTYAATYTASGKHISITRPTATGRTCDDAVMAQEASYLEHLPSARLISGWKDGLALLHADGTIVAEFWRVTP